MEELNKIILKLQELRQIPQYLFYDDISHLSFHKLRHNIYEKKALVNSNKLDFIILSPGGDAHFAYRIIKNLHDNFEEVNVIVPFWAKSAATLLSFGGNQIIMSEFGEFGPLDAQLAKQKEEGPEVERVSALIDELSLKQIETRAIMLFYEMFIFMYRSNNIPLNKNILFEQIVNYVTKFYEPLLKQLNPEKLGEKKRILDTAVQYAKRILDQFNSNNNQQSSSQLIEFLVNDCPDHGYIIDFNIISKFLNNVVRSKDISEEYNSKLLEVSHYFIDIMDNYIDFKFNDFIINNPDKNVEKDNQGEPSKDNKSDDNLGNNIDSNLDKIIDSNIVSQVDESANNKESV